MRVLYRSQDGPGPNTKARQREVVTELARTGLRDDLEALKGDVTRAGTSGFTTREDIVLCTKPSEGPSESLHKNPSTTTKGA